MSASHIQNTLKYAQIFQNCHEVGELYQKLITPNPVTSASFQTTLNQLVQAGRVGEFKQITRVGETKNFFHTPTSNLSLKKTRTQREKHSREKIKKTRKVGKWLKLIPTIQAVYLTGAVTVLNATQNDDIDIMIITKPWSLWTTRFILTIALDIFNIRRKPKSKHLADKLCLNLYLSQNHLHLHSSRHNLYTAHEIIQATPIWSKPLVHAQFLHQNTWIHRFLPHSPLPQPKPNPIHSKKLLPNLGMLLNPVEKLLFALQKKYMAKNLTQEKVGLHQAFFHPRNTTQIVLNQFKLLTQSQQS